MTSPNPTTESLEAEKWQQQYSATNSQWQDMKRSGEITVVIAFLLVVATLYAFGFAMSQFDHWLLTMSSQTPFYVPPLRILLILTFLTPTILLFVVLRFIFKQARELISSVYQPKTGEKISALVRSRLLGFPPLPAPLNAVGSYPPILINKPELEDSHWGRWFGGPAILVIYDGFAVYLERGNKFSRVVGPGFPPPFLERYERIKEVVDLRPQTKTGFIEPWTKDGIRIKLTIQAEVQIDSSAEALQKSSNFRYPFDPLAVKAAVEYTSVRLIDGKLQEQTWLDGAWDSIIGAINAFVAGHSLDELFVASKTVNNNEMPEDIEQLFSQRISEQVITDVRARLNRYGIQVLNIQITRFEAAPEIINLRTRYWMSTKLKISAQRNSRAEADRIRARELAHAEAQRTMLTTIMNKLEDVGSRDLTESLVLSLAGILDQNLEDPILRPLIAKESFAVLDRVQKLLQERF